MVGMCAHSRGVDRHFRHRYWMGTEIVSISFGEHIRKIFERTSRGSKWMVDSMPRRWGLSSHSAFGRAWRVFSTSFSRDKSFSMEMASFITINPGCERQRSVLQCLKATAWNINLNTITCRHLSTEKKICNNFSMWHALLNLPNTSNWPLQYQEPIT